MAREGACITDVADWNTMLCFHHQTVYILRHPSGLLRDEEDQRMSQYINGALCGKCLHRCHPLAPCL